MKDDSEFYARSQNSFFKKTSEKKDRQKELLEENVMTETVAGSDSLLG